VCFMEMGVFIFKKGAVRVHRDSLFSKIEKRPRVDLPDSRRVRRSCGRLLQVSPPGGAVPGFVGPFSDTRRQTWAGKKTSRDGILRNVFHGNAQSKQIDFLQSEDSTGSLMPRGGTPLRSSVGRPVSVTTSAAFAQLRPLRPPSARCFPSSRTVAEGPPPAPPL